MLRLIEKFASDDTLNFVKTGEKYNDFNSAVFNSAVAAQLGGFLTQLDTYNQAFGNMDMYSMLGTDVRKTIKYANS